MGKEDQIPGSNNGPKTHLQKTNHGYTHTTARKLRATLPTNKEAESTGHG